MNRLIHAVIIGHAKFAQGMLSAAESIVGRQEGVIAVSNEGLGELEMVRSIEEKLDSYEGDLYVFVDLFGGSSFNACRQLKQKHKGWRLVSGVNLPMLVTYLTYRTRLKGSQLLSKTLESGKRGMEKFD
ncbi:PTS mannose transporter subunit IID [bacterium]|nr:PTS mannose transporter subunit IID [bacterium]